MWRPILSKRLDGGIDPLNGLTRCDGTLSRDCKSGCFMVPVQDDYQINEEKFTDRYKHGHLVLCPVMISFILDAVPAIQYSHGKDTIQGTAQHTNEIYLSVL
jgi:hypothetical protein